MSVPYGVYIGRDVEVVVTAQHTIAFRRSDAGGFLESTLLDTASAECIGVCRTAPCCTEMRMPPQSWRYAFAAGRPIASDDEMRRLLGQPVLDLSPTDDGVEVRYRDGEAHVATLAETFAMADLVPPCPPANEHNVAQCLQSWTTCCDETVREGAFVGVTINTRKHMYIFEIMPGSIYCRAARWAVCDRGVVFNQNFRQRFEAYMIADNREAMNDLEYDVALFDADGCVWDDRSVYWSVSSVSGDEIVLHGCQGDTYRWKRPER
ncbi:MAG: hypothetical protein GX604_08940 [Actinobacteria bacterium]|nr:hypothetical protein [Actinomycetota bacterium]